MRNMVGNIEGLDTYYDHYKDTFEQQKVYLSKRDRYTIILLVSSVLLIGLISDPATFNEKFNIIIESQVSDLSFDLQFINTGLILITFWFLLQYYLIVLQIEKMYKYIDECEKRLSSSLPKFPINREGAYYLKSYPWLKDCANTFFVIGIPLAFIILAVSKIISEWHWAANLKYVDFVALCLIVIISILYMSHRLLREEYFSKQYNLKYYQRLLGYLRISNYSFTNKANKLK